MEEVVTVTKALADESRLRALASLKGGELCVCQIIELLGLAPATISKHMAVLRRAGLVKSRKEGRWVYYRLPEKPAPKVKTALKWFFESVRDSDTFTEDSNRLKTICAVGKEELCRAKAKK